MPPLKVVSCCALEKVPPKLARGSSLDGIWTPSVFVTIVVAGKEPPHSCAVPPGAVVTQPSSMLVGKLVSDDLQRGTGHLCPGSK